MPCTCRRAAGQILHLRSGRRLRRHLWGRGRLGTSECCLCLWLGMDVLGPVQGFLPKKGCCWVTLLPRAVVPRVGDALNQPCREQ